MVIMGAMFRSISFASALLAVSDSSLSPAAKAWGGGTPSGQAQVTVIGVLEPQIQAKAEDVFFRHGFEFKGAGGQPHGVRAIRRPCSTMFFTATGREKSDTTTRVTLYIIKKDTMTYALRTRSIAVRHTFGADSDTELFDIQGARYKTILDKIAKELRRKTGRHPCNKSPRVRLFVGQSETVGK